MPIHFRTFSSLHNRKFGLPTSLQAFNFRIFHRLDSRCPKVFTTPRPSIIFWKRRRESQVYQVHVTFGFLGKAVVALLVMSWEISGGSGLRPITKAFQVTRAKLGLTTGL